MHCAFLSYTLILFLPTSDRPWAASQVGLFAKDHALDLCSGPLRGLQAGASLMQEPSRPRSFLFHLRAHQPFMSSPFQWPWEFPVFHCLVGSLWEFLAHLFLPLFFPLPPFHLFLHCPAPQGLSTRSIASFAVLSNALQFSALLSSTALLYIHIWGRAVDAEKSCFFLERTNVSQLSW